MKNLLTVFFVLLTGIFPTLSHAEEKVEEKAAERLYELRTYQAPEGKLDELLTRFRDHTVALFEKHGMTNVGYWVPVDNTENLLIYALSYPDRESRDASWAAFHEDADWKKAAAASRAEGKLVESVESVFMTETDFSAGFGKSAKKPRLFEMRTYTATPGNLGNLHARFRDHTMELFKTHGMTNLAYFKLTPEQEGADLTLMYFLAHEDEEAAEKSWDDFLSDPEWIAVQMASEKNVDDGEHGPLTAETGVLSLYLKPTDFSPLK